MLTPVAPSTSNINDRLQCLLAAPQRHSGAAAASPVLPASQAPEYEDEGDCRGERFSVALAILLMCRFSRHARYSSDYGSLASS
jgi:hypothetical protein